MVKRAVEMEGTVTGEHGVGLVKRDYLEHELGETTVDAMRRVGLCLLAYLIVSATIMLTYINSSNWRWTPFAC
jgi:hypothetical protein